ncbi:hypothetical protein Hanom_Chr04g00325191 [Helianthus anomalus]
MNLTEFVHSVLFCLGIVLADVQSVVGFDRYRSGSATVVGGGD